LNNTAEHPYILQVPAVESQPDKKIIFGLEDTQELGHSLAHGS